MVRDGDEYVINGRKRWTSNALHKNCKVMIVMGKTDPDAPTHRQQSMMVVPIEASVDALVETATRLWTNAPA